MPIEGGFILFRGGQAAGFFFWFSPPSPSPMPPCRLIPPAWLHKSSPFSSRGPEKCLTLTSSWPGSPVSRSSTSRSSTSGLGRLRHLLSYFACSRISRCLPTPHDALRRKSCAAPPNLPPSSRWRNEFVNVCRTPFGNMENLSTKSALLSLRCPGVCVVVVILFIPQPRCDQVEHPGHRRIL